MKKVVNKGLEALAAARSLDAENAIILEMLLFCPRSYFIRCLVQESQNDLVSLLIFDEVVTITAS